MCGGPHHLPLPTAVAPPRSCAARQIQARGMRWRPVHAEASSCARAQPGKPPLPTGTVQRVVDLALGPPPRNNSLDRPDAGESRRGEPAFGATYSEPTNSRRIASARSSCRTTRVRRNSRRRRPLCRPPAHAVVLRSTKEPDQALDRTQPGLPMKPAAPARTTTTNVTAPPRADTEVSDQEALVTAEVEMKISRPLRRAARLRRPAAERVGMRSWGSPSPSRQPSKTYPLRSGSGSRSPSRSGRPTMVAGAAIHPRCSRSNLGSH